MNTQFADPEWNITTYPGNVCPQPPIKGCPIIAETDHHKVTPQLAEQEQQRGVCNAPEETRCFYVNRSGIVWEGLQQLQESLNNRAQE